MIIILIVEYLISVLRVILVVVLRGITLSSYNSADSAHLVYISVLVTVYSLIRFHGDFVTLRPTNYIRSSHLTRATQLLLMHSYFSAYRTRLVRLGLRVLSHPLLKTGS